MMTTTATMTTTTIFRVSARAFVTPSRGAIKNRGIWNTVTDGGGGNPVTIFIPVEKSYILAAEERIKLASSCSWESVFIEPSAESKRGQANEESRPVFRFFMPSGEEVSFCGHAAIGACAFLANKNFITSHLPKQIHGAADLSSHDSGSSSSVVSFITADNSIFESKVHGNEAELIMHAQHVEKELIERNGGATMVDFLEVLGLNSDDLAPPKGSIVWPTFINSSVARSKTLIPIKSLDRLHSATSPPDPEKFCQMCESIDSTGIYIYAIIGDADARVEESEGLAFEARQFPKSSGYGEDPATGIAAGALAASLRKRGIAQNNFYNIFQGTAMGKPSRIGVNLQKCHDDHKTSNVKISYSGLVAFDSLTFSPVSI
ncbi:hypothetical protein ACHAXS_012672 [Conticribra weissflogii]